MEVRSVDGRRRSDPIRKAGEEPEQRAYEDE